LQALGNPRLTGRSFRSGNASRIKRAQGFWSAGGQQQSAGIEDAHDGLLTPAQAAACFHIPEYQLRRACAEGRLKHRRVVNAFWISPAAVAAFARAWRAKKRPNS